MIHIMRTNIDIDDQLLAKAMQAGPYTTKKETVEAGLKLLSRQAAYREVLKWRGKLKWEGDDSVDWTQPAAEPAQRVQEPTPLPLVNTKRKPHAGR
jgi:Arc/MetJ family transcription regulator